MVMANQNVRRKRSGCADRKPGQTTQSQLGLFPDAGEENLAPSQLPIAGQAKQYCDHMQRNVTTTFDFCDKLIKAKDVQDSMKFQAEFFQNRCVS
jgi:hypothetical protein